MQSEFNYIIKFYSRSRHLRISIREGGGVLVTAPKWASKKSIDKFVESQKQWILDKIKLFKDKKVFDKSENIFQPKFHAARARAKKLIVERLKYYNQFYNFKYNRVVIRNQRSRWGSCSANKNLNFNYKLFFIPLELVDYVVVHELCHLKEMNHAKRFWALVSQTIPNYQELRKQLHKMKVG
jgi:predicted metal-dependent hydrolase